MITLAYDNAWYSIFRNPPPHFLCNFLAVPFLCVENFDFLCKDISLFFHPHNAGGFPTSPKKNPCGRSDKLVGENMEAELGSLPSIRRNLPLNTYFFTITKYYARPFPPGFDRFFSRLQFQCDSGGMRAFAD